jgi:hypothetical protein
MGSMKVWDGTTWQAVNGAGSGGSAPPGTSWLSGNGSPEGVVTANVGSLYSQLDGTTITCVWRKGTGSGNTGWVAATVVPAPPDQPMTRWFVNGYSGTIGVNAPQNLPQTSFTMPYNGSVILEGIVRCDPIPGAPATLAIVTILAAPSTPAVVNNRQYVSHNVTADKFYGGFPFSWKFGPATKGSAVSLVMQLDTQGYAVNLTSISGCVRVIPTALDF